MEGCVGARVTSRPTAKTAFCCSPYFRFWHYPEVPIAVHGVRLSEKSGKLLLGLSFTGSDPTRPSAATLGAILYAHNPGAICHPEIRSLGVGQLHATARFHYRSDADDSCCPDSDACFGLVPGAAQHRLVVRCRPGTVPDSGVWNGPGSADIAQAARAFHEQRIDGGSSLLTVHIIHSFITSIANFTTAAGLA
jgi:hypothetical protein